MTKANIFRHDFDSMGAFLDWIRDTPPVWEHFKNSIEGTEDFTGTADYEGAQTLARYGWKEGRDQMNSAIRDAARSVSLQAPPSQWLDVGGAYPLVPAAVAGDPMNMINHGENLRAQRPVIRFLICLSASAMVSKKTIMARGAAILSWVDALEAEGFRCEIMAHEKSGNSTHAVEVTCILKRAEEHLDIDRLAYAIVHPSMLRRHIFAFIERSTPAHEDSMGYGYGAPMDASKPEPDQIYFGKMHGNDPQWGNPASAAAHVRAQIEAGGLHLNAEAA